MNYKALVSVVFAFTLLTSSCSKEKPVSLAGEDPRLAKLAEEIARLENDAKRKRDLEKKLREKRFANNLATANSKMLSHTMDGHTNLYNLNGDYNILVIPVEFADVKFTNPDFYKENAGSSQAQEYLFGDHPNSMSNYYRHVSYGGLNVGGVVAPAVTVDGSLIDYGEAVTGSSDKAARTLVVHALQKLKEIKTNSAWWDQFDNWDLNDYDRDENHFEPDGFIDAVVLVYAGKDQASCQRSFDAAGTRPASADVPPGPRQAAAQECFNRIWPHRWSISLSSKDPLYSKSGPEIEGVVRPSLNGLKISDTLFALDYNMQSEFSDRSTFIHEFGHSLSLPDVYSYTGSNSTGPWEVMSSNGHLQAQEMSSFSRLSLGWLSPKIVTQGQNTTAYLGSLNYVSNLQRDDNLSFLGPIKSEEIIDGKLHSYDVVSTTPKFGEPVYRSLLALTEPSREKVDVITPDPKLGQNSAYSGRFDGDQKSLKLKMMVPATGNATLKFDTVYSIETETNFFSKEKDIKIITDYDLGHVVVNGKVLEDLRLISGDTDYDTLADLNPACEAARVLELRELLIDNDKLEEAEQKEFSEKLEICQTPYLVTKEYDLSDYKGTEVEVEIRYVTDAGYTEMGIVVDNITLDTKTVDFESSSNSLLGEFVLLEKGQIEKRYNQYYLFEYRDPSETFSINGSPLSYNMDKNIHVGSQAQFIPNGKDDLERFRLVTYDFQSGVLVWYFNSKFDDRSNNPEDNEGKGYYLVLNSQVKELPIPGVFSNPEFFDKDGNYDLEPKLDQDNVNLNKLTALYSEQRELFKCFGYTQYATYLDGEAPNCQNSTHVDAMQGLEFEGKKLVYRREGFNEYLPINQYNLYPVGVPFRNYPEMRTGLSTFRPKEMGDYRPFKVFKAQNGKMVLDKALSDQTKPFKPVWKFSDAESTLSADSRFHADTVVVEKTGFNFEVLSPSSKILSSYTDSASADSNDNYYRRPLAKIKFTWTPQQ